MIIYIIANFTNSQTSRFIELAKMFSFKGHDVTVITSDFSHTKKKMKDSMRQHEGFRTIYLHEPGYPNNVSIKRLFSHYCWGKEVASYLKKSERPDIIYYAVPSLTAGSKMVDYCKKNDVKLAIDIQDLWPEAFSLTIKNKILCQAFKPMEWLVNKIYGNADLIVAVSDTYRDRGLKVNKKNKNGLTVFLGNNIEVFDRSKDAFRIEKPKNEFWMAYIGTIGYSYDIPCVMQALAICNDRGNIKKKIKFFVIGDGPFIEQYKQLARQLNIDVVLTGGLTYEKMVGTMCSCDIVVNPIRKGAAQSITNKVGDYAFSGKAVINTQECEEYRNLVETYKCGINCECGNAEDVANAIETFASNPIMCFEMGINQRKLGEEKFDRKYTYPLIINAVEKLKQ